MRPMRSRLILVLALLGSLSACTMWREKPITAWKSATGPESFERLLWKEITAGNWNEVEKHLAPTFTATLPGGTYDRAGIIAAWKALPSREIALGEVSVAPHGADTVVTYSAQMPGSAWRMVTVWQEGKPGEWVAITHAEVPATSGSVDTQLPKM